MEQIWVHVEANQLDEVVRENRKKQEPDMDWVENESIYEELKQEQQRQEHIELHLVDNPARGVHVVS